MSQVPCSKLYYLSRNYINNLSGTDGFRVLCHQFVPSSLSLLASCISRCKTCSLTMKQLTPVLLRWVANGGQGQNARHRAFPLPTGRWSFIGWWRPTNHFIGLHRSLGSGLKRSVAFFFMRSRLESKMRNGRQAGRRPWEQQALLLVSMQGSDCSPAQAAAVVPSPLFAQFRKPSACHPKRWLAPRSGRLPGNSFQRSNGLLLQQVLLEAGGGRLSCLLSLPLAFVPPACAGGTGRAWQMQAPRARQAPALGTATGPEKKENQVGSRTDRAGCQGSLPAHADAQGSRPGLWKEVVPRR